MSEAQTTISFFNDDACKKKTPIEIVITGKKYPYLQDFEISIFGKFETREELSFIGYNSNQCHSAGWDEIYR